MIDILFLAHHRSEFTEAALAALVASTNWKLVRALWMYSDGPSGSHGPVFRFCRDFSFKPLSLYCEPGEYGGPVVVMNDYLKQPDAGEVFAKIDNDVIVPPGWLDQCAAVMEAHPELDLLGIEPPLSRTPNPGTRVRVPAPELQGSHVGYAPCDAIGGIGLMRRRAFQTADPMKPHSIYGGFTDWQLAHPEVKKGWIVPPLDCFLLDRLPFEPWLSLSKKYIESGQQRPWTNYEMKDSRLWDWWVKGAGSLASPVCASSPIG